MPRKTYGAEELVVILRDIEILNGKGKSISDCCRDKGIQTIGDIAKMPPDFLKRRLGINGIMLWQFANGLETSSVATKDFVSPIKSIGHGITVPEI